MTTAKAFESLTDYEYTVMRLKQPDLLAYVQKRQNTAKGLKQLFNLHHDGRIPHYDNYTKKRCKDKDIKTDKFFTEESGLKYFASFFKEFNEFLENIYSEQEKCLVWKTKEEWHLEGFNVNCEPTHFKLIDIWWKFAEIADYLTFTKKNMIAIYNENQVTEFLIMYDVYFKVKDGAYMKKVEARDDKHARKQIENKYESCEYFERIIMAVPSGSFK